MLFQAGQRCYQRLVESGNIAGQDIAHLFQVQMHDHQAVPADTPYIGSPEDLTSELLHDRVSLLYTISVVIDSSFCISFIAGTPFPHRARIVRAAPCSPFRIMTDAVLPALAF